MENPEEFRSPEDGIAVAGVARLALRLVRVGPAATDYLAVNFVS